MQPSRLPEGMRPELPALLLLAVAATAAAQEPGMVHAVDENGGGYRFVPAKLEVDGGAEIILMNVGQEPHKVRASDGVSFESPSVEPNGTVSFRAPTEPGEYRYFCPFHASADTPLGQGMVGLLSVRPHVAVTGQSTTPTGTVATLPVGATPTQGAGSGGPGEQQTPASGAPVAALALAGAALLALRRR